MKTDGGCPANPGPGAWAFVIEGVDSAPIDRAGFLPLATNNQAEYRAVTAAALFARVLATVNPPDRIEFFSDSELVVRQLNGRYQVRDETLRPFYNEALDAIRELRKKTSVTITHFRRDKNTRADELCNSVLRKNGVVLKSK